MNSPPQPLLPMLPPLPLLPLLPPAFARQVTVGPVMPERAEESPPSPSDVKPQPSLLVHRYFFQVPGTPPSATALRASPKPVGDASHS